MDSHQIWRGFCTHATLHVYVPNLKRHALSAMLTQDVNLHADSGVEGHRNCQSPGSNQSGRWAAYVGYITPPCAEELFRALLLHPPVVCDLCCLPRPTCWWPRLQHCCRSNLPFCSRSLSAILPVTDHCGHPLSSLSSMWNCGTCSLKTSKYNLLTISSKIGKKFIFLSWSLLTYWSPN